MIEDPGLDSRSVAGMTTERMKNFYKIGFFILIAFIVFLIFAPQILRRLFPKNVLSLSGNPESLTHFCFGISIPREKNLFYYKKYVTFNDSREATTMCLGFDIYYGE